MPDVVVPAEVRDAVQYLLEAAQSQGQGDELVIALLREAADLIKKRQSHGGALSDEQVAYLIESGEFTAEEFAETEAAVARGELADEERKTRMEAVAASLNSTEVALRLGIDASRVRHRQAKGSLYAFKIGGKRRYPIWQFTDDPAQPVVPGLATLAKAFPDDWHPAGILAFMSTPQRSARIDGAPVTPIQWLLHGGDPQVLTDILDGFLQS